MQPPERCGRGVPRLPASIERATTTTTKSPSLVGRTIRGWRRFLAEAIFAARDQRDSAFGEFTRGKQQPTALPTIRALNSYTTSRDLTLFPCL